MENITLVKERDTVFLTQQGKEKRTVVAFRSLDRAFEYLEKQN